jgi:hypothetical protein
MGGIAADTVSMRDVEPSIREHIMDRGYSGKDPASEKSIDDWEI